jgi:hypothetical protein
MKFLMPYKKGYYVNTVLPILIIIIEIMIIEIIIKKVEKKREEGIVKTKKSTKFYIHQKILANDKSI